MQVYDIPGKVLPRLLIHERTLFVCETTPSTTKSSFFWNCTLFGFLFVQLTMTSILSSKPPCTCGHQRSCNDNDDENDDEEDVESSFVHLPEVSNLTSSDPFHHIIRLMQTSNGHFDTSLCQECVHRVMNAIQEDIHRLQQETTAYHHAVVEEEERYESLHSTLLLTNGKTETPEGIISWTQRSFQDEIVILHEACKQYQEELEQLKEVQRQQLVMSRQLDDMEDFVAKEQNTFELQARAFDNDISDVSHQIRTVHDEMDSLATVRLHFALFELVVDERGLRYPLINELRLAYRPKGDVQWAEINVAWSQVLKLLLLVGTSVGFRPQKWRIVPLTSCAKLMYLESNRREVYTMGKQHMASSLRALTAFLDLLVQHIVTLLHPTTRIPHDMARNRIGSWDLSRIEDGDDPGWSNVIQSISLNLLWIQDQGSEWEARQLLDASAAASVVPAL